MMSSKSQKLYRYFDEITLFLGVSNMTENLPSPLKNNTNRVRGLDRLRPNSTTYIVQQCTY